MCSDRHPQFSVGYKDGYFMILRMRGLQFNLFTKPGQFCYNTGCTSPQGGNCLTLTVRLVPHTRLCTVNRLDTFVAEQMNNMQPCF